MFVKKISLTVLTLLHPACQGAKDDKSRYMKRIFPEQALTSASVFLLKRVLFLSSLRIFCEKGRINVILKHHAILSMIEQEYTA